MQPDMKALSCRNLDRIFKYFLLPVRRIDYPGLLRNIGQAERFKLLKLFGVAGTFRKKLVPIRVKEGHRSAFS